jgi:mono/diheme cytochrome c family protein
MIKPLLLVSAVVLLISISAPAQSSQDAASAPADVKMLYKRDCAMCHGANGDGKTEIAKEREFVISDWTDPKSLSGRPDQQLFNFIRNGIGKMPAESAGRANNDEVRSLIKYIRSMAKGQPAAAPAASTSASPNQ